ncbi:trigger factor [Buchnera aphidicola]|uniref:trigger factor n=1 Tax=Buchnera aphidicola TaxID=9 RepID=UPI0034641B3F
MKFSMEKNKENGDIITIKIPKKIVNNQILQEFIKINKKTKINGFRKGKTPIKIIEEKYGNKVYYDVFNKLMQKFFYEFIDKKKIKIIGLPKYFMHENKDEKEYFKYSVNYSVYPDFEIKHLKDIKVEKIVVNVTNEDIKKNIEDKQNQKNIWKKVNRKIKIYDRVTIAYYIYKNNKIIEQFCIKRLKFVVFQNNLISQLDNKIINHRIDDIVFFKIHFSEFHPEENLCNQDVTFKIKILNIEENQKNIEIEKKEENKNTEINYKSLKNKIDHQIKILNENHLQNQIIEKLIIKNPIKIPPILLKEEINFLNKKYIKEYKEKKDNILTLKYHVNLELIAKKRLYTKLIIENIIKNKNILVNREKVDLLIKKISLNYDQPSEIIKLYKYNKMLKKTIEDIELQMQAMKFLKNNVTIIEKYWNFEKFIDYQKKISEEFFI